MFTRYTSSSPTLVGRRWEVNTPSLNSRMGDPQSLAPTRIGRQSPTSKYARPRARCKSRVSQKIVHQLSSTTTGDNKGGIIGNPRILGLGVQNDSNIAIASTAVDGMGMPTLELPETPVDYASINPIPPEGGGIFFARQPQIHNEVEEPRAKPHYALTVSSHESAPTTLTFPLSCESRISMLLCGQVLIYDLKGLESDPRVIVELLKVTKSERNNWMTVGAFYRRTGQTRSAIFVMNTFVEEMKSQGLSSLQLKPAFLFLSGCESDLAKQAKLKGAPSSEIAQHAAAAQLFLQKVFGRGDREGRATQQQADSRQHQQPSTLTHTESEMQNLLDKNRDQAKYISELRSAKRHLEMDCAYERSLRRKCQQRLEEVEKQRDSARRMEAFALEQIKREISMRKEAKDVGHLDYQ